MIKSVTYDEIKKTGGNHATIIIVKNTLKRGFL
jgi:hypothetical protein